MRLIQPPGEKFDEIRVEGDAPGAAEVFAMMMGSEAKHKVPGDIAGGKLCWVPTEGGKGYVLRVLGVYEE